MRIVLNIGHEQLALALYMWMDEGGVPKSKKDIIAAIKWYVTHYGLNQIEDRRGKEKEWEDGIKICKLILNKYHAE